MNDMNDTNDTNRTGDGADEYDETRPLSSYDEPDDSRTEQVPLTTMLTGHGSEEPERRTHPLSVGHLVCGLVFLGIAASWGLRELGVIDSGGEQWVLPLVLVIAGGAGLLALVAKQMVGPKA